MKTVIFDLDGTILDTLQDLKNAVNHGLNFYNLPKKDLEFVRKAIGNGTTVLIQRCTPSSLSCEERNAVFNAFKTYYLEHYADYTKHAYLFTHIYTTAVLDITALFRYYYIDK